MLTYNHHAALNAIRVLQLADDQWTDGLRNLRGIKISKETHDSAQKRYGYAPDFPTQ